MSRDLEQEREEFRPQEDFGEQPGGGETSQRAWGSLSLRWKLVLIVAGIPLLILTPLFTVIGWQYREAYREANLARARIVVRQLERTVARVTPYIQTLDEAPGIGGLLQEAVASEPFEFVALVDTRGMVIYHSEPELRGKYVSQLAGLDTLEQRDNLVVTQRDFPHRGFLYLIASPVPMPAGARTRIWVVVAERAQMVDPPLLVIWPAAAGLLGAVVSVALIRVALDRLILRPLRVLASGVAAIGRGDLSYEIPVDREDEFGFVARSFNEMARRLRGLVTELERRVAERTADLQRRTVQLEAVSLVSQEAAKATRDVQLLLDTTVQAISEKFGFYHTGIFVLDDTKEWAILRAASSEGGKRMLARGHRLRVGQVGIVGFVAGSGIPRIAFNVGEDAVWFNNPDLPETRSELALPLKVENEVIGVLDVQSDRPEAFTDEDISTLQLMADQLAVALSNARLLEGMEETLLQMRELQEDYSRQGWARIATRMRPLAYEYDRVDVSPVPMLPVPQDLREGKVPYRIVVDGGVPVMMEPMKIGDRVLGYVGLAAPERIWTEDEIALVQSVSEQIAMTLESARLFEETRYTARQQMLLNSVLRIAASPMEDERQVLYEIARVLAHGLDMMVGIFTFISPNFPDVHPRAVVEPDGTSVELFERDFTLSRAHHIFFQGLSRPELVRMTPLLEAMGVRIEDLAERLVETYDFERVLYVPIRTAGGQHGFIAMVQKQGDPPLDPDTRALSQNLANQIGVVIDNLNLAAQTRRRSEEMQALYQISLDLSEKLSPEAVLEAIVEHALSLFNAGSCSLFLYDEETHEMVLSLDSGPFREQLGYRFAPEADPVGEAMLTRVPVVVDDYRSRSSYIPVLHDAHFPAELAVPLGEVGVLCIRRSGARAAFEERDVRLSELFAAQAAAAIENARLTQDAQRRAAELQQLYEAGVDLSAILDLQALLDRAAMWGRTIFDTPSAVVTVQDPQSGEYVKGQSVDGSVRIGPYASAAPRPGGLTERIIRTREAVLIRDNREHPGQEALVEAGLLSQMGAPLRIGDDVLGVIFVHAREPYRFSERDLQLLEFLAAQISSSLQNALQFRRTQSALSVVERQARYQTNISQAVAALAQDGTKAIPRVLELLGEAANVEVAYYAQSVSKPEGDFWKIVSIWGKEESPVVRGEQVPPLLSVALFEDAVRQLREAGYVQVLPHYLSPEQREALQIFRDFKSLLALAVRVEDRPPGFVGLVGLRREAILGMDEISALQMAATALSNTLARENLLAQVQRSLAEQEVLYAASAELNAAQDYGQVLSILMRHTLLSEGSINVSLNFFDRPWTSKEMPDWVEVLTRWSRLPPTAVSPRYPVKHFPSAKALFPDPDAPQPAIIEDVAHDPRLDENLRALYLHRFQASSTIFIPLIAGGRWVGYVNAIYPEHKTFPEMGVRRLVSLAGQAAVVVQNIRQLRAIEARARREQLIRQITERIQQAPDVEGVLQAAVRELGRTFGTARNVIQFRVPTQQQAEESS